MNLESKFCPSQNKKKPACYLCYYRPQRSWGKVMFLQVCVILFTGEGVPDQVHPLDQVHTPPGPGIPPGPGTLSPRPGTPQDQVKPPDQVHPPGPGTPSQDQVHPSRTRSTPLDQVPHPPNPPDQVPPWTRYTPPGHSMLGDTVYARAVRILLECNLVYDQFLLQFRLHRDFFLKQILNVKMFCCKRFHTTLLATVFSAIMSTLPNC